MTRESSDVIRQKFREWLKLDKKARKKLGVVDQKNFAIHHGISTGRLSQWKAEETAMSEDVFNPQVYVMENLQAILIKTLKVIQEKGSAKHIEMALKLVGLLIDKKEETVKFEFTTSDKLQLTAAIINGLREEKGVTGVCPVCFQREALCIESCLDSKPEYSDDREMEAVEVPA